MSLLVWTWRALDGRVVVGGGGVGVRWAAAAAAGGGGSAKSAPLFYHSAPARPCPPGLCPLGPGSPLFQALIRSSAQALRPSESVVAARSKIVEDLSEFLREVREGRGGGGGNRITGIVS